MWKICKKRKINQQKTNNKFMPRAEAKKEIQKKLKEKNVSVELIERSRKSFIDIITDVITNLP